MPRSPRPDFPGIAQHVVQRGNDRLPCFRQAMSDDRLAEIRTYFQQQRVLAPPRFQNHIEAILGRPPTIQPRGRPKIPDKSL